MYNLPVITHVSIIPHAYIFPRIATPAVRPPFRAAVLYYEGYISTITATTVVMRNGQRTTSNSTIFSEARKLRFHSISQLCRRSRANKLLR
jgi:hypothetical protein